MKRMVLIELNELNFDAVSYYIANGEYLPGFEKLIANGINLTVAESDYKNLEPWVQWPSVHTGKTYAEHNIFRLGDIVSSTDEQFFEKVERNGFNVGAVSAMNAANRLTDPAYFIPDPWTRTPCDSSFFSRRISDAVSQAVNDNSQGKLTLQTIFNLGVTFMSLVSPGRYISMVKYAFTALGKPWRKALFLDMILYEVHKTLFDRKSAHFSTLFLNAGAHIQHHYFFNSCYVTEPELTNPDWYIARDEDPFLEMLKVYDEMLVDFLQVKNMEFIVATGLSQKPYESVNFYYRLRDHATFLKNVGVQFTDVAPRMTRDFLVSFESEDEARLAEELLKNIIVDNHTRLFEEVDNRGADIFVVLTYSSEITNETIVSSRGENFPLANFVTFVAIKNGEHQSRGFAFFSKGITEFAPLSGSHVSGLHNTVLQYFGIENSSA